MLYPVFLKNNCDDFGYILPNSCFTEQISMPNSAYTKYDTRYCSVCHTKYKHKKVNTQESNEIKFEEK